MNLGYFWDDSPVPFPQSRGFSQLGGRSSQLYQPALSHHCRLLVLRQGRKENAVTSRTLRVTGHRLRDSPLRWTTSWCVKCPKKCGGPGRTSIGFHVHPPEPPLGLCTILIGQHGPTDLRILNDTSTLCTSSLSRTPNRPRICSAWARKAGPKWHQF